MEEDDEIININEIYNYEYNNVDNEDKLDETQMTCIDKEFYERFIVNQYEDN
jgi:hypothetical protein